jgi:circadian clock protein KaiC
MKKATTPSTAPAADDQRCPTGIDGLDEVLVEGLPSNCFYLVQGDPGSGKTTLALQFLFEGVRRGEKTLYITLSETKEELLKVAQSHAWSLDPVALFEPSKPSFVRRRRPRYSILPNSS